MRYIQTFKEPASTISNTKLNRSTLDFWNTYDLDILNSWKKLFESDAFNADEMNRFIKSHQQIASGLNYDGSKAVLGTPTFDVKKYQEDFHNKYGFGNTLNFWNAYSSTNGSNTTNRDIMPAAGLTYVGDGYWGEATDKLRRASFFAPSTLTEANRLAEAKGYRFVEDPDGPTEGDRKTYVLQRITDTTADPAKATTDPAATPAGTPTPTATTTPTALSFTPHKPNKDRSSWSDWLPNGMMLANTLLDNKRQEDLQASMKFAKKLPVTKSYIADNGYFERSLMQKQANDVRARGAQLASRSANPDYAMAVLQLAEESALNIELQANQLKANRTASLKQVLLQVADYNKELYVNTANENALVDAAAYNNMLQAKAARSAKDTAATNQNINANFTSLGEYLKTKRLNENAKARANYASQYSTKYNDLLSAYLADTTDFRKWADFGEAYNAMQTADEAWDTPENMSKWDPKYRPDMQLTDDQIAMVKQWVSNNPAWKVRYDKWVSDRANRFADDSTALKAAYDAQVATIDPYVTNQLDLNIFPNKKRNIAVNKEGGVVDRLSNFTRQIMQEQQNVRKASLDYNSSIQKSLHQQLERLSREQILLLRAVFK